MTEWIVNPGQLACILDCICLSWASWHEENDEISLKWILKFQNTSLVPFLGGTLSSEWLWSTHTWTGPGVSVHWKVSAFLWRCHPRQIKGGWHIIYASLKGEPFSRGPAAKQFASPLLWSNDFLLIERSQSNAGPFCALLCSVQKGFFSTKPKVQASAYSRGSPP